VSHCRLVVEEEEQEEQEEQEERGEFSSRDS
jgi:hypothetical protein